MKILIASDFHCDNLLCDEVISKLETNNYDLFLYCGDFCNIAGYKAYYYGGYNPLAEGIDEIKRLYSFFDRVDNLVNWYAIPGNHDPNKEFLTSNKWNNGSFITNVNVKEFKKVDKIIQILAVPYTPYCGWNWTLTENINDYLVEKYWSEWTWNKPIDIVITHAPPKGHLDASIYDSWEITLLELMELVEPHYYICGHVHECGGIKKQVNNTTIVNCARSIMEIQL